MAAACRPVSLPAAPRRARKSSGARGRAGARTADCTTARRQQQCVCVECARDCRLIGGVDLAQLASQWPSVPLHGGVEWVQSRPGSCPIAPGGLCPCTPSSARCGARGEPRTWVMRVLSGHRGVPDNGSNASGTGCAAPWCRVAPTGAWIARGTGRAAAHATVYRGPTRRAARSRALARQVCAPGVFRAPRADKALDHLRSTATFQARPGAAIPQIATMMLGSRVVAPSGVAQGARAVAPKARGVSTQAVRDVFMPALSSTMTEVGGVGRSYRNARRRTPQRTFATIAALQRADCSIQSA